MMKLFSFFREASPALPEKAELTLSELFDEHYYPHALVAKAQPRDDLSTFNTQIREDLGAMKLSEVTNPVLAKWVRQRIIEGYQRSTINKYIHLMNRMLSLAKTWGMVPPFNPNQEKIKTISVGDFKQRFLSEEEIARLLKACRRSSHPFLSLFIRLLLLTGARKGEALGMRWCDIDFAKRIWTVPKSKNGRSRRIILSEPAIDVLNAARKKAKHLELSVDPRAPVFTNPKTHKPYDSFYASWYIVREWAELDDVRIHDLRHTFASLLINKGVSLYEVQTLLGHCSIQMTQRYAHLAPDRLHQRAELVGRIVSLSRQNRSENRV